MSATRLLVYLALSFALFFLFVTFFTPTDTSRKDEKVKETKQVYTFKVGKLEYYENETFKVGISLQGGYIGYLYLKDYDEELVKERPLILLPDRLNRTYEMHVQEGRLVLSDSADTIVYTFSEPFRITIEAKNIDSIEIYSLSHSGNEGEEKRLSSVVLFKNKLSTINEGKIKDTFVERNVEFFGYRTQYFAIIIKHPASKVQAVRVGETTVVKAYLKSEKLETYVGPIDPEILSKFDKRLYNLYSWGNFLIAPFTKLIFYTFRFLHNFIPNYGWVIVVFAFLMKLIFSPLTYSSYRSMAKLKEIQPKLQMIQKVYKDDPKKMQEEMIKLYREHKVNPLGGCLPLLIQLPIFWALYNVLKDSIDFKNAPFMLWITDLSSKDPYYVLPIAMGAITLGNMLLQPQADRNARLIGIFMSLFLVFIFLNFPSGLVLYWLAYSLFGIFEQFFFKKLLEKGGK